MTQQVKAALEDIFAGGGETGELMRSLDWSATPLGSIECWPQSLKTAVRIMLTSRQAMFVWWGEELINLYNDAYKAIVGGKHPEALGQPAAYVWREIWDQVGPRAESAMLKNEGTYDEALLLIMERNGYPEETYYTFSYSPVPNDQGGTGGIICANTNDTQRIVGERQLALLRELAARTADARTFDEACTRSASCLEINPYDLPFALIYLVEPNQQRIFLAGTCGIERGHRAVPEIVTLDSDSVWSFAEVITTNQACLIPNLAASFDNLPTGAWKQSPHQAVAVPIAPSGQTGRAGILVVGLNPFRLFDDNYQRFIELVSAQIAASIANANAYEEERKRAEALAELDRTKTTFFSNVSHEFRTPLTLMLGPLEDTLANPSGPLPSDREQLETVHRNSLRLLKLVNSLLDFSRIEAGRVQVVYEPIDLAELTAELASVFRSTVERAGLQLRIECLPLPELAYVDREMWEKIVLNLLSNAFKFTFEGEITVALRWANDHIELEVRDTGIGIPAVELPSLFERFHRVPGVRGRTYEGSGIGLSLVQELVKLHSGTIRVSSQVNQGTSFIISIPTGHTHLPRDRIGASRSLASTTTGAAAYVEEALRWLPEEEGRGVKIADTDNIYEQFSSASLAQILLADDNADMRDYVKRLLVSQGYEVETVTDGVAALAAIEQQQPHLVLTDVMMPKLDGLGLLRELRADPNTRNIPIILLSARAGEESRIEGLEAGADDYLIKPFSARELLARVEATLKLARLRQEAMRQEQELRIEAQSAEANLERVLASINDQFLVLDREWRYTYVNDRVVETTGISREDLLGRCIWDVFPETMESQFSTELHRAVAEQTVVQFEYCYSSWQRWFENRVYPSVGGVSILVTEITERKHAEAERERLLQKLAIARARLEGVLQQMPAGVMIADAASGKLVLTNEQAKQIIGYSYEQALPLMEYEPIVPFEGFYLDGQRYEPEEYPLVRSLQTGEVVTSEEMELLRGDGSRIFMNVNSAPILDSEGQIVAAVVVFQDVSDRKRAEAEREQLLVRERTAREAAESANRLKDEFLAVLSHELRSPLNPILGWSRLLQTRKFDPLKTTEALKVIERNAKLQSELINDLLDVSRILQGKLSLNVCPVDLASTIQAAMETVRLSAQVKSIQLQMKLDSDVGQISGDSSRLQQVIWNLLSNAVKFTPQGGRVDIRLDRVGTQAQIAVSDTGKGINPDFLPYAFEYFRQADATTTRKFGGLGLGLAIVRHLVELHGGTVHADSPGEGQGATFTVRLPLMLNQVKTNQERQQSEQPLDLDGVKVLVVDDDADTRELLVFLLEQYGARVIAVASADEGLTALTQFKPDVLLSDIGMPEMDGYALIRLVRTLPTQEGGQIPAIALSAYAGEVDHQRAISAGFQRHIPKPAEPAELVAAIREALSKQ